jgi:hypothetical protein
MVSIRGSRRRTETFRSLQTHHATYGPVLRVLAMPGLATAAIGDAVSGRGGSAIPAAGPASGLVPAFRASVQSSCCP